MRKRLVAGLCLSGAAGLSDWAASTGKSKATQNDASITASEERRGVLFSMAFVSDIHGENSPFFTPPAAIWQATAGQSGLR
jgi:hypothetical protein